MRIAAVAMLALAGPAAAERAPGSEMEKTAYAVGVAAADSFRTFDLSPQELELALRGLRDALTGQPLLVDMATYRSKVDALALERRAGQERKRLASLAAQDGAQTTASGLVFVPVAAGNGATPSATDVVKVDYSGTFGDGTVFDSSARKGEPATIPLERAIRCWKEAVPRMKVGGKAKVACPPALAYGERGLPGAIPPNATLFFDIELLSIPARVVLTEEPAPGSKPAEAPAAGPGQADAPPAKK